MKQKKPILTTLIISLLFLNNTYIQAQKSPDSTTVANGNIFAFSIFQKVTNSKDNILLSPLSIRTSMAMAYYGSNTSTKTEIAKAMLFDTNTNVFNKNYGVLVKYIGSFSKDKNIKLFNANSMWVQKDFVFLKKYITGIKKNFGAWLQFVNFKTEPKKCRELINKWVETKTQNKIKDLIQPNTFNELTRLVLVNALYFYSNWDVKFETIPGKKIDFKVTNEKTVQTDFMFSNNKYKYIENEKAQIVDVPYLGKKFSMIIILPKETETVSSIFGTLNNINYTKVISHFKEINLKIIMPKFSYSDDYELNDILKKMGIVQAFSLNADFSGMTGKKDLMIDKVLHKTFIEVNETGTEAAASTAVVIKEKSAPKDIVFKADHPFIYLIKDNKTNLIIFIGMVNNPLGTLPD